MFGLLQGRLLPILAGVIVTLGAAVAFLNWRLHIAADERDVAQAALRAAKASEKEVTRYVERIVKVPGPTVIRDRLVHSGVCLIPPVVPGPGSAAATPAPDAVAGRNDGPGPDEAGRAAESLRNAALNQAQCQSLLNVIRPQTKQK